MRKSILHLNYKNAEQNKTKNSCLNPQNYFKPIKHKKTINTFTK